MALLLPAIAAPYTRPLLLPGPALCGDAPSSSLGVAAFLFPQGGLWAGMLSYQHAYHAGNLADLHKHALLATMLSYLVQKPKPLTYLETHSGRGLYDLSGDEAARTGEASAGIERALREGWLPPDHPLIEAIRINRSWHGASTYPGSPLIANYFLRDGDVAHLAELHPAEAAALRDALPGAAAKLKIHEEDGFAMANALCPPTPRRGMLLIDPSFEVKSDYQSIPDFIARIARKWNVGSIALWYPILADRRHLSMLTRLDSLFPDAMRHEVGFPPARAGHGMVGSGMFIINPTYGLEQEAAQLSAIFAQLG